MLPATISVAGITPIFGAAAADDVEGFEEDELASDMQGSLRRRDAVEVARPAPDRRFRRGSSFYERLDGIAQLRGIRVNADINRVNIDQCHLGVKSIER
ncbi:hypothetical protein QZM62_11120 [Burkholderia multivorans]|nr:hypothetical protein [Burkholderia multivorans]